MKKNSSSLRGSRSMRSSFGLFLVPLLVAYLGAAGCKKDDKVQPDSLTIAIASQVEIEPIRQLRDGFREEFAQPDMIRRYAVSYQADFHSQGDAQLYAPVADQIVAAGPDVVYVLGSQLAKAIQERDRNLLIAQGAVTDPVKAELADSWQGSGRKYIATSDRVPMEPVVALLRALLPAGKILGVPYNSSEVNSKSIVEDLEVALQGTGWRIVSVEVSLTSDLATNLSAILDDVDAVFIPPDNTVHGGLETVGALTDAAKVPYLATTPSALGEGAVATVGLDFYDLGRQTARLVARVLDGADPAALPIERLERPQLRVSRARVSDLGLVLDENTLPADTFVVD